MNLSEAIMSGSYNDVSLEKMKNELLERINASIKKCDELKDSGNFYGGIYQSMVKALQNKLDEQLSYEALQEIDNQHKEIKRSIDELLESPKDSPKILESTQHDSMDEEDSVGNEVYTDEDKEYEELKRQYENLQKVNQNQNQNQNVITEKKVKPITFNKIFKNPQATMSELEFEKINEAVRKREELHSKIDLSIEKCKNLQNDDDQVNQVKGAVFGYELEDLKAKLDKALSEETVNSINEKYNELNVKIDDLINPNLDTQEEYQNVINKEVAPDDSNDEAEYEKIKKEYEESTLEEIRKVDPKNEALRKPFVVSEKMRKEQISQSAYVQFIQIYNSIEDNKTWTIKPNYNYLDQTKALVDKLFEEDHIEHLDEIRDYTEEISEYFRYMEICDTIGKSPDLTPDDQMKFKKIKKSVDWHFENDPDNLWKIRQEIDNISEIHEKVIRLNEKVAAMDAKLEVDMHAVYSEYMLKYAHINGTRIASQKDFAILKQTREKVDAIKKSVSSMLTDSPEYLAMLKQIREQTQILSTIIKRLDFEKSPEQVQVAESQYKELYNELRSNADSKPYEQELIQSKNVVDAYVEHIVKAEYQSDERVRILRSQKEVLTKINERILTEKAMSIVNIFKKNLKDFSDVDIDIENKERRDAYIKLINKLDKALQRPSSDVESLKKLLVNFQSIDAQINNLNSGGIEKLKSTADELMVLSNDAATRDVMERYKKELDDINKIISTPPSAVRDEAIKRLSEISKAISAIMDENRIEMIHSLRNEANKVMNSSDDQVTKDVMERYAGELYEIEAAIKSYSIKTNAAAKSAAISRLEILTRVISPIAHEHLGISIEAAMNQAIQLSNVSKINQSQKEVLNESIEVIEKIEKKYNILKGEYIEGDARVELEEELQVIKEEISRISKEQRKLEKRQQNESREMELYTERKAFHDQYIKEYNNIYNNKSLNPYEKESLERNFNLITSAFNISNVNHDHFMLLMNMQMDSLHKMNETLSKRKPKQEIEINEISKPKDVEKLAEVDIRRELEKELKEVKDEMTHIAEVMTSSSDAATKTVMEGSRKQFDNQIWVKNKFLNEMALRTFEKYLNGISGATNSILTNGNLTYYVINDLNEDKIQLIRERLKEFKINTSIQEATHKITADNLHHAMGDISTIDRKLILENFDFSKAMTILNTLNQSGFSKWAKIVELEARLNLSSKFNVSLIKLNTNNANEHYIQISNDSKDFYRSQMQIKFRELFISHFGKDSVIKEDGAYYINQDNLLLYNIDELNSKLASIETDLQHHSNLLKVKKQQEKEQKRVLGKLDSYAITANNLLKSFVSPVGSIDSRTQKLEFNFQSNPGTPTTPFPHIRLIIPNSPLKAKRAYERVLNQLTANGVHISYGKKGDFDLAIMRAKDAAKITESLKYKIINDNTRVLQKLAGFTQKYSGSAYVKSTFTHEAEITFFSERMAQKLSEQLVDAGIVAKVEVRERAPGENRRPIDVVNVVKISTPCEANNILNPRKNPRIFNKIIKNLEANYDEIITANAAIIGANRVPEARGQRKLSRKERVRPSNVQETGAAMSEIASPTIPMRNTQLGARVTTSTTNVQIQQPATHIKEQDQLINSVLTNLDESINTLSKKKADSTLEDRFKVQPIDTTQNTQRTTKQTEQDSIINNDRFHKIIDNASNDCRELLSKNPKENKVMLDYISKLNRIKQYTDKYPLMSDPDIKRILAAIKPMLNDIEKQKIEKQKSIMELKQRFEHALSATITACKELVGTVNMSNKPNEDLVKLNTIQQKLESGSLSVDDMKNYAKDDIKPIHDYIESIKSQTPSVNVVVKKPNQR